MTTDTAARVTRMVVHEKGLQALGFIFPAKNASGQNAEGLTGDY